MALMQAMGYYGLGASMKKMLLILLLIPFFIQGQTTGVGDNPS